MIAASLAYVRSLWRADLPLARVVVTHMLLAGTVVNIAASALALLSVAAGLPVALGVALHFAPLPYNLLLLFAVWRGTQHSASAWAWAAQPIALLWFVAMLVA